MPIVPSGQPGCDSFAHRLGKAPTTVPFAGLSPRAFCVPVTQLRREGAAGGGRARRRTGALGLLAAEDGQPVISARNVPYDKAAASHPTWGS
ncbi:hypothetical protein [Streptomyces nojiriensis]|uniref:hypothetical protein n=1 Tax=Streptomyces nojiriensis TaxID=66374 RepID=UPI0036B3F780